MVVIVKPVTIGEQQTPQHNAAVNNDTAVNGTIVSEAVSVSANSFSSKADTHLGEVDSYS